MKVEVKGIVDGQELYWGYSANAKLVNITSDGTYDIPPLETVNGNLSFRNGNIVGACNITITQLPSGQSVPTKQNDGFTEQDLINYVLENLITK